MLKPIFHDKRVGESYPLSIDFSNRFRDTLAGATIQTGVVTAPAGITVGSTVATATAVRFLLSGGSSGVSYDLLVSATLDSGSIVQELIRVAVI